MQLVEIAPVSSTAKRTRLFKRVSIVRHNRPDWDEFERGGYRKIGQTIEGFPRFVSAHVHNEATAIHS